MQKNRGLAAFRSSKFYARQGANEKLRRSICWICKEQFFVSNAVLRRNLDF
jgi:hypothetical protein